MEHLFSGLMWAKKWLLASLLLTLVGGCNKSKQQSLNNLDAPTAIQFDGKAYTLIRQGKPYFIKGAGGVSNLQQLKEAGGNSVRIWDDVDAGQLLDEAQRLGLTVMFGIWVEREMESFDYDDQAAVERQYQRIRKIILKYRTHPALLMWCMGNEWAQEADNVKVYDEVNRLTKLAHDLDPNHPVSTAISPDSKRAVWLVSQRCPEVDILAVNSYGLTEQLADFFRDGGWNKPYLISEYGAPAYWETPLAPWGAPDEPTSQQKMAYVRQFYQKHIDPQPVNCFGAYLFYWGTKQEETHTWFSVFDQQGRHTPLVELMHELWSGPLPGNVSPVIDGLFLDGQPAAHKSFSRSNRLHTAAVRVHEPDGDPMRYQWEIKIRAQSGTDYVGVPRLPIKGLIESADSSTVHFRLPDKPGAYRLFVAVYDNHQHVATANVSFYVQGKQP
jgi:hypothetical protein